MSYKETFYPESRFGGFTDIDGTIAFYLRVSSLVKSSYTILDVGCGVGEYQNDPVAIRKDLRIFKGKVEKVIGIDVDAVAQENPFLDEFRLIRDISWPVNDNTVDLILCDNVLEHIEDPDVFFSESYRVLRDGGYLCIRTPNLWSYVGLLSKLIPSKYHLKVTKMVQDKRKDAFPTFYRCNSIRRIKAKMKQHNFVSVVYGYEAEPSYLSFSVIAYWLGVLHQKFAPKFLRLAIFAFGQVKK